MKITERIGEIHTNNRGFCMKITKYSNNRDCDVIFDDGSVVKNIQYKNIKLGCVTKPEDRAGEKYITNEGYPAEIVEYISALNCTIKLNDWNNTILYNIRYDYIKSGSVKNPYHKSICEIGYTGEGGYKSTKGCKSSRYYTTWVNMLKRCYDTPTQKKHPTYKICTVDERWHNFQNYAQWFEENCIENFEVDKDILVRGNKIYSPETCCFVPCEINSQFTTRQSRREFCIGVLKNGKKFTSTVNGEYRGTFNTQEEAFQTYKIEKELQIKELANKWKDRIKEDVYKAMYNWEITNNLK